MRILVVAAHPDDEILGCGGTIERFRRGIDQIEILILGKGRGDKLDNRFDKKPLLKWVKAIEKKIEKFKPDTVFTHFEKDLNIDHRMTFQATLTACRPLNSVKNIYSYEVLSSTEWSYDVFKPDMFVKINIDDKIDKMKELYSEEMREWPHPRSPEGITALAQYRGMQAGLKYAEAFRVIRQVL